MQVTEMVPVVSPKQITGEELLINADKGLNGPLMVMLKLKGQLKKSLASML